ncbi:MAG: hypothetical protein LBR90_04500 [Elusimicrobiota bacterium]|jgi:hypothetical protein|nr:hypothetical protein [Elusimicrobiota bacterium]
MRQITQDILINLLALEKGFLDYEFYHCFLGDKSLLKAAARINFDDAYLFLKNTASDIDNLDIEDAFPCYRKTYIKDLLACALAQADKFVYKRKIPFTKLEEALTSSKILPPFNIRREFALADKKISALAGCTIEELRKRPAPLLNGFKEIKKYARNILEDNLQAALGYAPLFKQFNLKEIINKMQVRIVNRAPNGAPCFFKY